MSDDPDKTPILCVVCEGKPIKVKDSTIIKQYSKYKEIQCRWCTNGAMTAAGHKRWLAWSEIQRKKTKPTGVK